MTQEKKNNAEEAQVIIEGTTPQEVMEKRKEKKSLISKIWDGVCWTGKKIWENKGTVAAVAATVVVTKVVDDRSHKKELKRVAACERNNGAVEGIMASTIEHSKLPEENKQSWYNRAGMNRENCKNVERATRAVINEYLEEGKTSKQA
jgi:hypothetical protein